MERSRSTRPNGRVRVTVSADPAELLTLGVRALDRVLPRLLSARTEAQIDMSTKSSATDIVTEFDRWSEATIVETILEDRPDDGFIGEEGASIDGTSTDIGASSARPFQSVNRRIASGRSAHAPRPQTVSVG